MNRQKIILIAALFLLGSSVCSAQTNDTGKAAKLTAQAVKSSPAYAEVLLRKSEVAAELEEMLTSYTEEFPKVKKARFESELLQKELTRLLAVNNSEIPKLTQALGKLLVRKAELEADLWDTQRSYGGEHPTVKRAKRKFEIFEQAVKEIFP